MAVDEHSFDAFWAVFPRGRKAKKADARRIFKAIISGKHRDLKASAKELVDGALRYGLAMGEHHPYVMMPSTWLNGGCWEDEDLAPPEAALLPTFEAKAGRSGKPAEGPESTRSVGIDRQLMDKSWAGNSSSREDNNNE